MDEQFVNICKLFNLQSLKEYQKTTLLSLFNKKDCLVVQPTGSGKSLLFQAWPFLDQGHQSMVIVISPLVSLVEDQVNKLQKYGISAGILSKETIKDVLSGKFNIVFSSPESILEKHRSILKVKAFVEIVIGIAIDESHCIKEWGGEGKKVFRHWYGKLAELRSFLDVPFLALTATATQDVQDYICENLSLVEPDIICQIPNRKNIKYFVLSVPTDDASIIFKEYVIELQNKLYEAARVVVFCRTMKLLRQLYAYVDSCFDSFHNYKEKPYARYHSRSSDTIKKHIVNSFGDSKGSVRFLMATIAFGMGIDCKGLHTVIHFGPPCNLDEYFQESGRVGRDGCQSKAIMLTFKGFSRSSRITDEMKGYCNNLVICRRKILLQIYGQLTAQIVPLHECCDICHSKCECGDCPAIELFITFEIERNTNENSSKEVPDSDSNESESDSDSINLRSSDDSSLFDESD